jgi:hypothetical protein
MEDIQMAKRKLAWTHHAKERMRERDVKGWEVLDALKHGRWIITDKGQKRVIHQLTEVDRLLVGVEVEPCSDGVHADTVTVVTVIIRGPRDTGVR